MTKQQFDALVKLIQAEAKLAVDQHFGLVSEARRNEVWQAEQIARGLLVK